MPSSPPLAAPSPASRDAVPGNPVRRQAVVTSRPSAAARDQRAHGSSTDVPGTGVVGAAQWAAWERFRVIV
ncbi:hypothetical protein ACFXG4_36015 [Nocardia sp. NPDC059246]|uniref:hypothetical protein n=1 Tax=unclassified Nocardia TaxID=2637762 RepID=UPI00369594A0